VISNSSLLFGSRSARRFEGVVGNIGPARVEYLVKFLSIAPLLVGFEGRRC